MRGGDEVGLLDEIEEKMFLPLLVPEPLVVFVWCGDGLRGETHKAHSAAKAKNNPEPISVPVGKVVYRRAIFYSTNIAAFKQVQRVVREELIGYYSFPGPES